MAYNIIFYEKTNGTSEIIAFSTSVLLIIPTFFFIVFAKNPKKHHAVKFRKPNQNVTITYPEWRTTPYEKLE